MKRFKVSWTEHVGYYTFIQADSKKSAEEKFHQGNFGGSYPDDFLEIETDSIEIKEVLEDGTER